MYAKVVVELCCDINRVRSVNEVGFCDKSVKGAFPQPPGLPIVWRALESVYTEKSVMLCRNNRYR